MNGYQNTFKIRLPSKSYICELRQLRRQKSRQWVECELAQSGIAGSVALRDFNAKAFRIRVPGTSQVADLVSDPLRYVHLRRNEEVLFSGPCTCIRKQVGSSFTEFVFRAEGIQNRCPDQKQIRNPRQQLTPHPILSFKHPLSEKYTQLDAKEN